jgi:DNA invertase Pin-like site-specific DNA recombinase
VPKRAVFFERVSTQRQAEHGVSLETMRVMAEKHAAANDLTIVETILEVISGRKIDRAGIRRLEELAKAKAFDVLIVYKIDRLSRRRALFHRLLELFQANDIGLVSLTQPLNTTTAAGRLMLGVLIEFAAFEAEMISERVHDNLAQIAASGRWTGGRRPPTGYRYDAQTKQLLIDEGEAPLVRAVFAHYLETQSIARTCRLLNEAGLHTVTGAIWTHEVVTRMLRAPWYGGYTSWGKRRQVPGAKYQRRMPKDQHLTSPGQHEALIDPAQWHEVQRILDGNAGEYWSRESRGRPWGEVLRCGGCGRRMTVTQRSTATGKRALYRCDVRRLGYPCEGCGHPTELLLDLDVIGRLGALWDEFGAVATSTMPRPRLGPARPPARRIEHLQAQIERARELYVEGHWDRATFQAKTGALEAQLVALAAPPPAAADVLPVVPLPSGVAARWPHLAPAEKRDLLRAFVEVILVGAKDLEVVLRPRPEPGYPATLTVPMRRIYLVPGGRNSPFRVTCD